MFPALAPGQFGAALAGDDINTAQQKVNLTADHGAMPGAA